MPEKENIADDASEEMGQEGADDFPDRAEGEVPDHAELTALLEDARGKADEHWDQVVRTQAEMDNLRKRSERDLANATSLPGAFANELLPVKDSLEMGLAAFATENGDPQKLQEGVELTLQMLTAAMEKSEIREVNRRMKASIRFSPGHVHPGAR